MEPSNSSQFAFITGASSGIGAATARRLAARGYSLILLARRGARLEKLAAELKQLNLSGREILPVACDIREGGALERLWQSLAPQLAKTTVLVNNAGLAKGLDSLEVGSIDDWEEMIETNLTGLLRVTRALLPHLKGQTSAHIINLGSIAGRQNYAGGGVYCATKHAVHSLTETLRLELMGTGVHVTTIAPGMVETEFSEVRLGDKVKAKAVYQGMEPLTAEDVADAIDWCVSRPARVNVQELVLMPLSQARADRVHRR